MAYLLLGLSPGASERETVTAYKRLALQWHPDRNPAPEAGQRFAAIRDAYDQINDWNTGGGGPAGPVLAIQMREDRIPVQRFGIDDRRWDEVTAVKHLGATAYEASTAKGERVVIKQSGNGMIEYRHGEEGPVQEALAAKLGEIKALGVATARTVMIETAGVEGRQILGRLRAVGAGGLADDLAPTQVFLVMERAPGLRADKAGEVVAASSRDHQIQLFARLGRLWAFDVLINNTDRFYAGNWGNVILGPEGSVYGIDQMVGLSASNLGAGFASEEAAAKLKTVLDAGARRHWARGTFQSLSKHMGPDVVSLEGLFVLHFERGALEGMESLGGLRPKDLLEKQAELPAFAEAAAGELGLGGAAAMLEVFADARAEVGKEMFALYEDIGRRETRGALMQPHLAEARRVRGKILTELGSRADGLVQEWSKVDHWWTGKDAHWAERRPDLSALNDLGRSEFERSVAAALPEELKGELRAQIEDWRDGLKSVWTAAAALGKPLKHETIKPIINELDTAVRIERGRVPIVERV
jgi:hypothetical protein